MDWKEITQKSKTELDRLLQEKNQQLRDRRFKVAQGQHKDVREIREIKRDIARLLTKRTQDGITASQQETKVTTPTT